MKRDKSGAPNDRRKTEAQTVMRKTSWKPGNMLSPVPVVLVSCGGARGWKPNLITIAWIGSVCSDPPMLSIAVRPERYSHAIIKGTGEFVVNLPSADQAKAVDWCGVVSGRDVDKFAGTGLTPAPGRKVACPLVMECPLNIECRIRKRLELGSHTLLLAEVVAVHVSSQLLDSRGRLNLQKAGLMAFAHGHYYALGRHLGHFGFSIRKPKKRARA
jgi:flavin reductase (DIM6/NTAB) family NADH-FMN oxidoreductase RutF